MNASVLLGLCGNLRISMLELHLYRQVASGELADKPYKIATVASSMKSQSHSMPVPAPVGGWA